MDEYKTLNINRGLFYKFYTYIFQNLDGFNPNLPCGQSKEFTFPNENSGMDVGTPEYSNSNYRPRYTRIFVFCIKCISTNVYKLINAIYCIFFWLKYDFWLIWHKIIFTPIACKHLPCAYPLIAYGRNPWV